jgi:hypothetical protein
MSSQSGRGIRLGPSERRPGSGRGRELIALIEDGAHPFDGLLIDSVLTRDGPQRRCRRTGICQVAGSPGAIDTLCGPDTS